MLSSTLATVGFEVEVLEPRSGKKEGRAAGASSCGCDSICGWDCISLGAAIDASEPVVEYERLGGRDARCDDMDDVRLLTTGVSLDVLSNRVLVCESGRKNDTVLDLRRACLSPLSFSSSSIDFFTSGSLNSSFPFLSDAKYSSPRPKTTCSDAQSRAVPSAGFSHSFRAGGRS